MAGNSRRKRKRKVRSTPKASKAYLAIGAFTAIAAVAASASLSFPGASAWPAPTDAHERNADAALHSEPADYRTAERENQAVLMAAPLSATAWVRQAYIRKQELGTLDATALENLEKSYRSAPFGPDITRWRLRFMFENWALHSPGLRARAIAELEVFSSFHRGSYSLARTVRDPTGRLAAILTTRRTYRTIVNPGARSSLGTAGPDRSRRDTRSVQ